MDEMPYTVEAWRIKELLEKEKMVEAVRTLLPDFKQLVDSMEGKYDPMLLYALRSMYEMINASVETS